jgi:hypothetical protein
MVFIDSNIPMYAAGADHPHREPSRRFLRRVQAGSVEGCTSTEVLQEILYRYSKLGRPDFAKAIYEAFVESCPLIFDVTLADTDRAKDLLVSVSGISSRDAIHAAVMKNHEIRSVATFDADFERIPGINRHSLT